MKRQSRWPTVTPVLFTKISRSIKKLRTNAAATCSSSLRSSQMKDQMKIFMRVWCCSLLSVSEMPSMCLSWWSSRRRSIDFSEVTHLTLLNATSSSRRDWKSTRNLKEILLNQALKEIRDFSSLWEFLKKSCVHRHSSKRVRAASAQCTQDWTLLVQHFPDLQWSAWSFLHLKTKQKCFRKKVKRNSSKEQAHPTMFARMSSKRSLTRRLSAER